MNISDDQSGKLVMEKENEVLVAVPESEYEHLKQCKQELLSLHKAEIQRLQNEMAENCVRTMINSFINK